MEYLHFASFFHVGFTCLIKFRGRDSSFSWLTLKKKLLEKRAVVTVVLVTQVRDSKTLISQENRFQKNILNNEMQFIENTKLIFFLFLISATCYIHIKIFDLFPSAAPEDSHETRQTILHPNLELHFEIAAAFYHHSLCIHCISCTCVVCAAAFSRFLL